MERIAFRKSAPNAFNNYIMFRYNFKGKLRMATPKTERNILKDIDLQIMLCNESIRTHRKSIEKVKRACGWNGPQPVGGIDYSKQSSHSTPIAFIEGYEIIQKDERKIEELKEERRDLHATKRRIEKIYASLSGDETQIYYKRVIAKKTQAQTARELHMSERQVQRIEKGMKKKGLLKK